MEKTAKFFSSQKVHKCTFSRHAKADASITLVIWLNEKGHKILSRVFCRVCSRSIKHEQALLYSRLITNFTNVFERIFGGSIDDLQLLYKLVPSLGRSGEMHDFLHKTAADVGDARNGDATKFCNLLR